MSNRAKIEAIRNDRERHFASVFFDHDEWESQPAPIYFKGGCYHPDFLDKRRGIYIEVVGTRQAFANNRYKYLYMLEVCKDLKLEFRSHKGEILNPYKLSFASRSFMKASEKVASTGVMPEGKTMNIKTFREDLRRAISASGISQSELARLSGVDQCNISKFLNPPKGRKERDMRLSVALRLWPFVYGDALTPAAPATSPEASQVGGDAA